MPLRVVNIGKSERERLLDFVDAVEEALGVQASRNLMEMPLDDVPATWADARLLERLADYRPQTGCATACDAWYRGYYGVG